MTDENNENQIQPSWYIDEGIPGIGERPSWLPDKFKTIADLAKSNAELERKFTTMPEEYDFSKSKYIDPDYAPFQDLRKFAREKRVPKDVMDKMVDSFDKYMDEFSTDYKEEVQKLGDNAKERINILDNWAKANLSKEAYNGLTSSLRNANAIKALEELRGKMMSVNPQIPSGNENSMNQTFSVEDIKTELADNLEKYKTDANYRKDISRRLEIAAKNTTGYVDKVGA